MGMGYFWVMIFSIVIMPKRSYPESKTNSTVSGEDSPVIERSSPVHETLSPMVGEDSPMNERSSPVNETLSPMAGEDSPVSERSSTVSKTNSPVNGKYFSVNGKRVFYFKKIFPLKKGVVPFYINHF